MAKNTTKRSRTEKPKTKVIRQPKKLDAKALRSITGGKLVLRYNDYVRGA
jgi:hypothetical protein